MNFDKLCSKIDSKRSAKLHRYYQKLLVFLFLNNKDPFNRTLKRVNVEKRCGKGYVDLFLKWERNKKQFTEIIEIETSSKKKNLENKIKLYSKKADLFSICTTSKNLSSLISIFPKMRKDLPKINIVYLVDDSVVTKNKRKIVGDQKFLVGANSPFFILNSNKNFTDFKEFINSRKHLMFDALLPIYLK